MPAELKALLELALALPPQERMSLAQLLLASVESGPSPDADFEWDVEIQRRIAAYDAGESPSIPADIVFATLRNISQK